MLLWNSVKRQKCPLLYLGSDYVFLFTPINTPLPCQKLSKDILVTCKISSLYQGGEGKVKTNPFDHLKRQKFSRVVLIAMGQ